MTGGVTPRSVVICSPRARSAVAAKSRTGFRAAVAANGTETENVAGSSDASAEAGMRPPRPVDWAAAVAAKD